jgi:hypothetical protein
MPGWYDLKAEATCSLDAVVEAENPQQLTPRQPSATCAASVNLRAYW